MTDKACRECGVVKPLTEFYKAAGCVDGHRGECKSCFQAKQSARYRADPERQETAKERTRQWRLDNEEYYRERSAAYRKTDAYKQSLRKTYLKQTYGLTPEDYDRMLEAQGGGCAICGKAPRPDISLHIDHDHETGRIRGLLCFTCNNGLGQFQDDPELLIAAAEYVGMHRRVAQLIELANN
jgi:hypothetical protein